MYTCPFLLCVSYFVGTCPESGRFDTPHQEDATKNPCTAATNPFKLIWPHSLSSFTWLRLVFTLDIDHQFQWLSYSRRCVFAMRRSWRNLSLNMKLSLQTINERLIVKLRKLLSRNRNYCSKWLIEEHLDLSCPNIHSRDLTYHLRHSVHNIQPFRRKMWESKPVCQICPASSPTRMPMNVADSYLLALVLFDFLSQIFECLCVSFLALVSFRPLFFLLQDLWTPLWTKPDVIDLTGTEGRICLNESLKMYRSSHATLSLRSTSPSRLRHFSVSLWPVWLVAPPKTISRYVWWCRLVRGPRPLYFSH